MTDPQQPDPALSTFSTSTSAPPSPSPSSRGRRLTVAGLAALGLAGAGAVVAHASSASGSIPGFAPSSTASGTAAPAPPAGAPARDGSDDDGTVTAASSSSLTVKDVFGASRTYALTSATTVHAGRGVTASVSSLKAGQHVSVRGTKVASGYTARAVDIRAAHIDGTVKAIDGDTLTVTDEDGFTRTVELSSSTKVTKDGAASTRSSLKAGSVVVAEGKVDVNGTTLDATAIDIRTKAPAHPVGGPDGRGPGGPGHGGRPGGPGGYGRGAGAPPAPPSGAPSTAPSSGSGTSS